MMEIYIRDKEMLFSSLSESGFIPTRVSNTLFGATWPLFSSLSESGFIPTFDRLGLTWDRSVERSHLFQRVASFLLWIDDVVEDNEKGGSHLFQRVASFLLHNIQE